MKENDLFYFLFFSFSKIKGGFSLKREQIFLYVSSEKSFHNTSWQPRH